MTRKSFYKQSTKVNATSTTTLYEIEKPTRFTQGTEDSAHSFKPIRSKWGAWALVTGSVLIFLIVLGCSLTCWWYMHTFEQAAGIELRPLVARVWDQRETPVFSERDYKTFLLLGLDQSKNQRDASLLTDTLILMTVRQSGAINMVSLPRDLWVDSLKTKINALYYYGHQTNPDDGITLVSSVISEITGFPVDYYVIINMDAVKLAIDAIGGVIVPVERSFEDTEYPREINLSSNDPAVLYETIRFEAGINRMDGATALKFIRSRHSTDSVEGTDEGRERRQQILLSSLRSQLVGPTVIANPKAMGALYKVWDTAIQTNLSEEAMFQIASQINRNKVSINSAIIPVQEASSAGLIYHPVVGPAKQWVFLPVDSSWNQLRLWLREQL